MARCGDRIAYPVPMAMTTSRSTPVRLDQPGHVCPFLSLGQAVGVAQPVPRAALSAVEWLRSRATAEIWRLRERGIRLSLHRAWHPSTKRAGLSASPARFAVVRWSATATRSTSERQGRSPDTINARRARCCCSSARRAADWELETPTAAPSRSGSGSPPNISWRQT